MAEAKTDYRALARKLSDALVKVRPLGGSELFIRVGEEFFADPDYCGREIEKLRRDNHELKMRLYSNAQGLTPRRDEQRILDTTAEIPL
jgi:hypothetical protein